MSQLKKGAALSYLTIILTNGIGLLLTPFMIRQLGTDEYGLYSLIGSFVASISVLDFGLNNTTVRFVAKYRAKQQRVEEENFLATVMLIYGLIATIITIIGLFLFFQLDSFFPNLSAEQLLKAKIMFGILIFNLAITLPGGAFTAVCSAYEHFVFPRSLSIVKYLLRAMVLVGLLLLGGDSVSIVVMDTIFTLATFTVSGWYVLRVLKARFKLHFFQKALVREIFTYSIWIFVFAIVSQFQWRFGQVILGSISTTAAVGVLNVGILLGTYYGTFSSAISSVFLPRATKMTVLESSPSELTDMMIRIGRFSMISLLMVLGGFLVFGREFVLLWVGPEYDESYIIALVIMFAYTLPLAKTFANAILEARSKFTFKAVTYISLIVIGTAVGAWLVQFYGTPGIIYGSSGGWILSQVAINIYYQRNIGLQMLRFYKELARGLLPVFAAIVLIGWGIDHIPGSGWLVLGVKVVLFSLVYLLLIYRFGMNDSERATTISSIPFLKKRFNA